MCQELSPSATALLTQLIDLLQSGQGLNDSHAMPAAPSAPTGKSKAALAGLQKQVKR